MKNLGIICGGFSSEYEISLKSANTILKHLPDAYTGYMIVLSDEGWLVKNGYNDGVFDLNTGIISFRDDTSVSLAGAIIYIHGNPGENGKIQALLDMLKIPYVNANVLASALSFDKWYCNQFLKSFGIPVANSVLLKVDEDINEGELIETLGLPIFVKPTDSGSSYGISKVKKAEELRSAIDTAFKEGRTIVLESFLNGIEVTCGVFRDKTELTALPLTEIVSENEFFDYEAKYQGKSNEITPARISDELTSNIQKEAKRIYQLLNLKSIARIDFMLVGETPYVIEVNTTPGFSAESIVPKMLAEAGISITSFWETIIETELILS
jgi:D-alanine-D-alanine ligase